MQAPYPGFVEPLLAEMVERVPRGDRWRHEIKHDGYRAQLHIINGATKVYTRRGHDWSKRFRNVAHDADLISAGTVIIDAEIVVPGDATRRTSRCSRTASGATPRIIMIAFNLLYLNGHDLRRLPLEERKKGSLERADRRRAHRIQRAL
ncbi:ATP-dependent DNA ligase [Bradyrhizobium sp. GM24.11]